MNEIFVTSDQHLYHKNIIGFCNRPFLDEYEMNEEIILRWNQIVDNDDIVLNLGDVSAGLKGRNQEFADLIKRFNGHKVLIRGNHDHQDNSFYVNNGFIHVMDHLFFDGILFTHAPGKQKDTHHPHKFNEFTSILQETYKPILTIHGHVHSIGSEIIAHHNCAVDRNNFIPIHLKTILELNNLSHIEQTLYNNIKEFIKK